MHPNRAFHWQDRDEMLAFVAQVSFATIFVCGEAGPGLVHAPVIVSGDHIRFHIARSNGAAEWLEGARGLLSCIGPEAYISPDWYGVPDQVPTWNYVAVECEGPLRRLDEAELADLLDALSADHEARLAPKRPWTRAKMAPGRFEAMLRAITGFEMAIEEVRGTRKLGQNKKGEVLAGAIAGLRASGRDDMAALMSSPAFAGEGDQPRAGGGARAKRAPDRPASPPQVATRK